MLIEGSLGNAQLFDLSNYPRTINGNINYKMLKEKQLFGKVSEEKQALVNLRVEKFDSGHPRIKNKHDLLINITINQMMLNYIQQPALRIIDFIHKQFMPIFEDDDFTKKQTPKNK